MSEFEQNNNEEQIEVSTENNDNQLNDSNSSQTENKANEIPVAEENTFSPDDDTTPRTNFVPYIQQNDENTQNDSNANKTFENPYVSSNQSAPNNEPFSYSPYQDDNEKFTPPSYDNNTNAPKKKGNALVVVLISIIVILVIAIGAIGVLFLSNGSFSLGTGTNQEQTANNGPNLTLNSKPSTDEETTTDTSGKLTVTQIAKQVRPSVVGIIAYSAQTTLQNFGQSAASTGSGVIMSSDGYIITNAHVISDASRVAVVLDNGDEHEGKIIGFDTKTDLAVVKINKTNLTAAQFGNSSEVNVGEDVIAIGNPTGLELAGSITRGIVSAVDRAIQSSETGYTMNCIQTDAAINPGNSGGALVNMYGQVIGINSSKIASVDYEGIGFAISANEAKPVVDDLIKYGYVKGRARIGITYTIISDVYAQYQNIPSGLYVQSVDESLDVYAKGVRAGDIITKIDGKQITDTNALVDLIKNKTAGETIKLTIFRYNVTNSRTFTVNVVLAEDKGDAQTTTQEQQQQQQEQYSTNPFSEQYPFGY